LESQLTDGFVKRFISTTKCQSELVEIASSLFCNFIFNRFKRQQKKTTTKKKKRNKKKKTKKKKSFIQRESEQCAFLIFPHRQYPVEAPSISPLTFF